MAIGRIVVVGASAGGVKALQTLAASLPAWFPAPILVAQHVGSHPSILPGLLQRRGPLPAAHASDGEPVVAGRIHVAPPDHHMLLDGDAIRLSRGAKENHARPAIDPLFRSAAVSHGAGVIGVLLTGLLDDGTVGLQAIERRGGIAVVQDPDEAEWPSMPLSALRHVQVHHRVGLAAMGPLLAELVALPVHAQAPPAAELARENEIMLGRGNFREHLEAIGRPSTFVCPECEGPLWEVSDSRPPRYRCHTGHAFTLRNLQHAQSGATEDALWGALRALQEKEALLGAMAASGRGAGDVEGARRLEADAETVARHARTLRSLIEDLPPPRG